MDSLVVGTICGRCGVQRATAVIAWDGYVLDVCRMCAQIALLGPGVTLLADRGGETDPMAPPKQRRTPHAPSDLQWLWDGLAGKSCPRCDQALDNGTGLTIEPGGIFHHTSCERAPKQWEGPIRRPKPTP